MALTRRARRSIRVGRASFLGMPCGRRICRDRLDGGFCHGIESSWSSVESDVSSQPNFFIGGTISVQTATGEGAVVRRQGELKSAAPRLNALIGRPSLAPLAAPSGFRAVRV